MRHQLYHIHMLEFSLLDKPHNPMLNSGAIMNSALASSLIEPKMKSSEKFDYILQYMKVCCTLSTHFNFSTFFNL